MITFIFFTKNEERRLKFALQNVINYGEVIILDGGSTDSTKEIAESFGAKFYTRPDIISVNVETQTNLDFVKSVASYDWIYWGYVDNIAPVKLLEEMARLIKSGQYRKINLPMKTYLWGRTDKPIQKSYGPFLFHKDFVSFSDNYIHGFGKFLGNQDQVWNIPYQDELALCHFSTYNLNKFILGHLRYALAEAEEKFQRGEKFSLLKTLGAMVRFIIIYGKLGIRHGRLGILICLNYASFRLMVYTRLYELENNITIDNIEDSYSKIKEKIIAEQKSNHKPKNGNNSPTT